MSSSSDPFPSTRWSLVLLSNGRDPDSAKALEELCQTYWDPLYRASRRMGCSSHDAEDRVQGFFREVLRKDLFSRADPEKGKLRAFLQTAFRRYVQDEWSRQKAEKRGGNAEVVTFDEERDAAFLAKERHLFDQDWAQRVIDCSLERLEVRYIREDQAGLFTALRPYLTAEPAPGIIRTLAGEVGLSAGAAKVGWHRLRKRFAEALRSEVAETLGPEEDVDEELRYLVSVCESIEAPA